MAAETEVSEAGSFELDAYGWIGRVLVNFAEAELAIGRLCIALGLPISNGSLTSIASLRDRLRNSGERKCVALEKRIGRWSGNRPYRHLLAHASVTHLRDADGREVIVTRHLPRDPDDVTPDRMWTGDERRELLRQVRNDGRSICDHVAGILADPGLLAGLRKL